MEKSAFEGTTTVQSKIEEHEQKINKKFSDVILNFCLEICRFGQSVDKKIVYEADPTYYGKTPCKIIEERLDLEIKKSREGHSSKAELDFRTMLSGASSTVKKYASLIDGLPQAEIKRYVQEELAKPGEVRDQYCEGVRQALEARGYIS